MVTVPPQTTQNAHCHDVCPWLPQEGMGKPEADTGGVAAEEILQQNPHHRLSHHEVLRHWQREQLIQKSWKRELSRPHRFRNHRLKNSLPEEHSPCTCFLEAGWHVTRFLNALFWQYEVSFPPISRCVQPTLEYVNYRV